MTAFPGFCMSAVVRGAPWGAGRRANPTQATARLCVGGASRRFRLRQSGPAGDGRQSQPHAGDGPGGRRAAVPTPWATTPAGSGRRANPTRAAARPCVGGASRCFRLRPPYPAGEGRQVRPCGEKASRRFRLRQPCPASGGRRPYAGGGPALCGKGFPLLPAPATVSGGRRTAGPALRGKGFPPLPAPPAVSGGRRAAAPRGRRPGLAMKRASRCFRLRQPS